MLRMFLIAPSEQSDCIRARFDNLNQTHGSAGSEEAVRNKHIAIFVIALVAVAVLAWYESLPRPHGGPIIPTAHWTEYVLSKNGNHTQLQASYSDGPVSTEQILWLNFDNRTAVYHYFGCTPVDAWLHTRRLRFHSPQRYCLGIPGQSLLRTRCLKPHMMIIVYQRTRWIDLTSPGKERRLGTR